MTDKTQKAIGIIITVLAIYVVVGFTITSYKLYEKCKTLEHSQIQKLRK